MNLRASRNVAPRLLLPILAIVAVVLAGVFAPAPALAADNVAYVTDSAGNKTYYTDRDAAKSAAYGAGKTLVLLQDWDLQDTMYVADSKELTIDMNGYRIAYANNDVSWYHESIHLYEHAKLTLISSRTATFNFKGYVKDDKGNWGWKETQITSGGLVASCGGKDGAKSGAGVYMDAESTLTLEGVAIAGCAHSGVDTKKKCTVNVNKGAIITANGAESYGAGIEAESGTKINIDGGQIVKNYCTGVGGGIWGSSDISINMKNHAKINDNSALAGGGVYICYSNFAIQSEDGTGEISGNRARNGGNISFKSQSSGGGIHIDQRAFGKNNGSIKGITIANNFSWYDAGGIELDQQNTVVEDCTITGNGAGRQGGGIYVCNKNNTIRNCTITDNYCNYEDTITMYGGGGVYVSEEYDIALDGKIVITGNTRERDTDNPNDDLFLADHIDLPMRAYFTGNVSTDSKIGIRTDAVNDRRVGKNTTNNNAGSFFMDKDAYHVSYGTDSGGDVWQRKGESGEFSVTLDGVSLGSYKPGDTVTVNGEPSNPDYAFQCWSKDDTIGLAPFDDYVKDPTDSKLTFAMPKNDVKLVSKMIGRSTDLTLSVAPVTAGEDLPTTATLDWGGDASETVDITWLDENGQVATTAAYGAKYQLCAYASEDRQNGLAFADDISAETVQVYYSGVTTGPGALEAHVEADGRLYVLSNWIETDKPRIVGIEDAAATVTAGTYDRNFVAALPATAKATLSDGTTAYLDTNRDRVSSITGIDDFVDAMTHMVKEPEGESATYTIRVPLRSSDKVASMDDWRLEVNVTVFKSEKVAIPTLSPAAGTYEDSKVNVTASCSTDGATIMYSLDGGPEKTYSAATGITVSGTENTSTEHTVDAWAVKDGKTSERVTAKYVLDDTHAKRISVQCSDTALYSEGDEHWSKTFYVTSDIGKTITIAAPAQDGRDFDHWEWEGAPAGTDLSNEKLVIKDFSVDYNNKITAVYTPVITAVDLKVETPAAHEFLSQGAEYVKVKTGSKDNWTDVTSYFSSAHGAAAITWSPTGDEEGKADHLTRYTAMLQLNSGGAAEGVKYKLADDLDLWVSGEQAAADSAWISDKDGIKCLNAVFPETGKYVYKQIDDIGDVSISFEDASRAKSSQDEGGEGDWGLPKEVGLTFVCDETDLVDVEWESVEGFDPTKLEAQTVTVKGTVSYPDYVDATGAPAKVEATVRIAAPEQVEAPTASVEPGTYHETQGVELSCNTYGATIRYTTDGSEPTEESEEYDGRAIEISQSTVIKAKAFRDGMIASETSTVAYSIVRTVTFDSAGGSAVEAQDVEVGACATEPAAPTRNGYTFLGWTLNGEAYDFATPVTADLTLTAVWEKNSVGPDVDPDVDPDTDPDGKGDEQPDGKQDGSSKRDAIPETGDTLALAGIVAAAGAAIVAIAAYGVRFRRNR